MTNQSGPHAEADRSARQTDLGAVFISYASEDAEAAGRIAAQLQTAGIEVWFDRTVLRSGDAWDQKIRREIRDCALFIAVISRNTEVRKEGYFRLEWHLADQRTHLMAKSRPFLVPVCIDDTREEHAEVPESFSLVHWTRLPAGETSTVFVERVVQLLSSAANSAAAPASPRTPLASAAVDSARVTAAAPGPTGGMWARALTGRLRWLVFAGVGALILAGAMLWFAAAQGYFWRNPLANAQFFRLTDWSGTEQAAAISRDGRTIAFIADHDGSNDVWITEMGSARFLNLTRGGISGLVNNPEIRTLGFSADGSLVTVWARRAEGLRSGDINILAVPSRGGELRNYLRAAEIAWSSDGRQIVYHTTGPGDPMFVAKSAVDPGRRIYAAPAGVHCHFQVWSPDVQFIYFTRGVPPDRWDLWRIRPSGLDLERLTFENSFVSHPVLLDARTLLYLATDARGGGPWLYEMDLRRRVPHRITFGLERYTSLAASADGARLAVTVDHPSYGLWHIPLSTETAVATDAGRLSAGSLSGLSPRAAPGYVLYLSRGAGRPGMWKLANGTQRELWSGGRSDTVSAPAIARDGRIAFTVARGERTLLYVMQSDGTHLSVVADSFALSGNAAWAPDGKSIIVAVLHEGEPRLVSFNPLGGAPLPLVYEYSVDPVWSPDGQFLLYSGAQVGVNFPLRAVEPDGRPYPLPAVMLPRGARRIVFGPEPGTIVALRGDFTHKDFWLIDLKTGAERRLTQLPTGFDIRDFDLSADKRELLFDRVEETSTVALIDRTG
ncbi:MAG: TIR domain-containing protein [Steroidobacteraceae bacterium]